jgi:hypothetical protein
MNFFATSTLTPTAGQLDSQRGRHPARQPGTGLPGPDAGDRDERGTCFEAWRPRCSAIDSCRVHLTAVHETAPGGPSGCGVSIIASRHVRPLREAQASAVA